MSDSEGSVPVRRQRPVSFLEAVVGEGDLMVVEAILGDSQEAAGIVVAVDQAETGDHETIVCKNQKVGGNPASRRRHYPAPPNFFWLRHSHDRHAHDDALRLLDGDHLLRLLPLSTHRLRGEFSDPLRLAVIRSW